MPNILKRFINPKTTPYLFPTSQELVSATEAEEDSYVFDELQEGETPETPDAPSAKQARIPKTEALDYAKLQAEAIMEAARHSAAEYEERARLALEQELEQLRSSAYDEGFLMGKQAGLANAQEELHNQRAALAQQLGRDVTRFLDQTVAAQEEFLTQNQGELRDLTVAIAEKIVRVSLKNSGEVIARMIARATEKMRRKEWVHIYIAGCDAKSFAQVSPGLIATLSGLSEQVRIIPLADEESGTCMIEMPDEIIDASVSTQFSNIRDLLSDSYVQSTELTFPTVR